MQRSQVAFTDSFIQLFSWGMLFAMLALHLAGGISFGNMIVASLAMMSSFGPVVALSNLSTTLAGTLAAGHRVLQLMEEEPQTVDRMGCSPTSNLDSLNEAIILRSLAQMGDDVTVVLVSHRESTMALATSVVEMDGA